MTLEFVDGMIVAMLPSMFTVALARLASSLAP